MAITCRKCGAEIDDQELKRICSYLVLHDVVLPHNCAGHGR